MASVVPLECAFHMHLCVQISRIMHPTPALPQDAHALIPGTWDMMRFTWIIPGPPPRPNTISQGFESRKESQRLEVLEIFNIPLLS